MKYTIKTSAYNERRYGKPWLAIVTTNLTKYFEFVDWEGRPGRDGEFNFDAEPGTMIARGQRDNRKGRGGVEGYYVLLPDGGNVCTSCLIKSDGDIRKMSPAERWRYAAEERLAYWAGMEKYPQRYQEAMQRSAWYSRLLGVPDPIVARMAVDLGLVTPDDPPCQPQVSMDAFGL